MSDLTSLCLCDFNICLSSLAAATDANFDKDNYVKVFEWQRLTAFQRLLLIKAVRPSALVASIRCFVQEQMGEEFVTSGTTNLEEMFHKADAKTPLIFILSPGNANEILYDKPV
jgi:hypothetical protein